MNKDNLFRIDKEILVDVLESLSDGVVSMDGELKINYFNAAAEELLDRRREEVLGRSVFEAFPEVKSSVFDENFTWVLENAAPIDFELDFGNAPYANWFRARVFPKSEGITVLFQVITEEKRAEEKMNRSRARLVERLTRRTAQLEEANQAVETAAKAKGQFLSNLTHELRTPLNPIINMADMLESDSLTDDQRDQVRAIGEAGRKLLVMINDLIELTRLESGEIVPCERPFSLAVMLKEFASSIERQARSKGLDFIFENDPNLPDISGDPTMLKKILSNLASNAVKFTDRGSIELRVALGRIQSGLAEIRFSLSDTGVGVPEEKMNRLFQDLTQADGSATRRHGGLGLGLTLTRRMIEVLGGRLTAESREGQGSIFHCDLTFPVHDDM